MYKILDYLRKHFLSDFNVFVYAYIFIFLSLAITCNYSLDFENIVLNKTLTGWGRVIGYICFFAFAYYGTALPVFILQKKSHLLQKKQFWIKSSLLICLLGWVSGFSFHFSWIDRNFNEYGEKYFLYLIGDQFKFTFLGLFPLVCIHYYFSLNEPFFGLTFKGFDYHPYALMLLIMFPFVFWASFQPDFLQTYPVFRRELVKDFWGMRPGFQLFLFELCYGFDFIFVEILFRGALVIGMANIIGKEALLPMVCTYAFLHFAKPLGETFGSIAGGYVLGVIALHTRSIWGGCMVQIGRAHV